MRPERRFLARASCSVASPRAKRESPKAIPRGRFNIDAPATGAYLVIVTRVGFSEAARTVVVMAAEETLDVPVQLHLGGVTAEVTVTAARAERESRQIPLHVESLTGELTRQTNPLSTGDALSSIANVTPVGNGPFGVRPRLRGLDSTRFQFAPARGRSFTIGLSAGAMESR